MNKIKESTKEEGILQEDPLPNIHGVLLSNAIEYYALKHKLIDPFDKEKLLRPASYDLTLGEDCAVGGTRVRLSVEKPFLVIPPHQVAIVSTYETIKMPRFLIGRWSARIKWVYEGLVWVGGPQVDPGYVGRLFCPLYNLSNTDVTLEYRKPIVSIDFVKTSPFIKNCKEYTYPPPRKSLEDYNIRLQSMPRELVDRVTECERNIREFRDMIQRFQGSTFAVLSIIIAALSFMSAAPFLPQIAPYMLPLLTIIGMLSIIALGIIILILIRRYTN